MYRLTVDRRTTPWVDRLSTSRRVQLGPDLSSTIGSPPALAASSMLLHPWPFLRRPGRAAIAPRRPIPYLDPLVPRVTLSWMVSFREDPSTWQELDFRLLQNGPVAMYFDRAILYEDSAWLAGHGYQLDTFDSSGWSTPEVAHTMLAEVLRFPDYYGRNLDAFNDCLHDLEVEGAGLYWFGVNETARVEGYRG